MNVASASATILPQHRFHGLQSPTAPKANRAEIAAAAQRPHAVAQPVRVASPQAPPKADAPAEAPRFTQADLEALKEAWGTREGQAGFDPRYDLHRDGRIDGADLGKLLQNMGPGESPRQFQMEDLMKLLGAFGASEGDDAFLAEYDLHRDGRIDGADLGKLLQRLSIDGVPPEAMTPEVRGLFAAWGASAGEERYAAEHDLNQDHRIDGADLGLLLQRLSDPSPSPTPEPAPGKLPGEIPGPVQTQARIDARAGAEPPEARPSAAPLDLPAAERVGTPITISQRLSAESLRASLLEQLLGQG